MEIEIRAFVKDMDEARDKLVSSGAEFVKRKEQKDLIFASKEIREISGNNFILRIRDEKNKKSFTYKGLTGKDGVWDEHETNIDNPEELRKMLISSGFIQILEMNKKRECFKLNNMSINLDVIENLGNIIEMEIISENPDKSELIGFASQLGIEEKDIIHKGSVGLLLEKSEFKEFAD